MPKRVIARILVRPPTRPSDGARTLRDALGDAARLSRRDPIPRQYRTVINWGNSTQPGGNLVGRMLNRPEAIRGAVNKLSAFRKLQEAGVPVPEFSTEKPTLRKGDIWLARTSLTGSGGEGILPLRAGDTVPDAPLYVRYIPKKLEYRVHVVNGAAIFAQLKKRRSDAEQTKDQKLIRNYDNGWVFCPAPLDEVSQEVKDVAIRAVAGLGLDFGAVDLVVANGNNSPVALEVNSAPGLASPRLIQAYADAFRAFA